MQARNNNPADESKYIPTKDMTVTSIYAPKIKCNDCKRGGAKQVYHDKKEEDPALAKFEAMIHNCQSRRWVCTIIAANILALFGSQLFLCALCGMPMTLEIGVSFMASIDRINNTFGYILSNVRLVISEFNTSPDADYAPPTRQVRRSAVNAARRCFAAAASRAARAMRRAAAATASAERRCAALPLRRFAGAAGP